MKDNINNLSKIADIKAALIDKRVSASTVKSIEGALKSGLVFRKPSDLGLLNLPLADVAILEDSVSFGAPDPVTNIQTLEYRFRPADEAKAFYGYQFSISHTNRDRFFVSETYPIEDDNVVYADIDLNDIAAGTTVTYRVKAPQGDFALIAAGNPPIETTADLIEVAASAVKSMTITVANVPVEAVPDREANASYQVKGKLISSADDRTDGYQIVIMAAVAKLADGAPDYVPVAFATTEANGYFLTSFLIFNDPADMKNLIAAKAVISKDDKVWERPIALQTLPAAVVEGLARHLIPRRLILVIDGHSGSSTDSADGDCGCSDLNFHEKKTLEEFSYYTVVRTTEPAIIADTIEDEAEVDLDDIYGTQTGIKVPLRVFRKYAIAAKTQAAALQSPDAVDASLATAGAAGLAGMSARLANPALSTVFNRDLLDKMVVDGKISDQLKGKKTRRYKGRSYLSPLNQIDWDDEPTIYQAASVAHGHLLHFKQEWRPDGYSLGDLMYSLPLAPGQKKQIAVLDWERRESAANSQQLDYEESLNNTLVRDRDISEVVNATLNENIKANSSASTGGIGFGLGGAIMGVFSGGSFGGLLGISGGKSSAGSTANQDSHRDSTASSLQSLSDRTSQAASSVRSQRSTVIQTVGQGERAEATAESVANYNHCHAVTIQYFEVLRHFSVHTRLADVQECLFVPLQISPFDLEKILRWRSTLEKNLGRRDLLKGFDAVLRILKEKENAENYYDSIGFPRTSFAEQPMKAFSGSLVIEFAFFNTQEGKVSDDLIRFLKVFGIAIDASQYADRYVSNKELAEMVGPRAIEFLLDSIVVETDKGTNLRLDLTLLTRFQQNARLQVSLRQSAASPTYIRRDLVDGIKIRIDKSRLSAENQDALTSFGNKFMKITVHSGNLRYRSDSMSQYLFSGGISNDLFADSDSIYIDTPLNGEELRNPRGEDIDAANKLIHHLNENLEYYHKAIWFEMTPERRYMLLDGIIAPGKANGRSVASVVENRLIGIAGNSLIMPVAPGNQLDPTIDADFNLFDQYYSEESDPARISLPTKGVYAESVMGKCNACEEKDESRFWRWEESPIPDSPNTQIDPLDTGTRRADPGNLQAKDFPSPIVSIQNAPAAPDPTGLSAILQLIGKGDSFRDLTGLNQNQLNALAAFQKSLDTAQSFGKEAGELAKAAGAMKLIKDGKDAGTLKNEDAAKHSNTVLDNLQKDPNASRLSQGVELIDTLKKEGKISEADADAAKAALLKGFQDSSNARTPMGNDEIGRLAEKSRETNKDISVKRPDGETVDIKQPSEGNGDTGAAATGGTSTTIDITGGGGTLKFLPTGATEPVDPSIAQIKVIADNGGWLPAKGKDYGNLLVGDRHVGVFSFRGFLSYIALKAKATFQTVNLVGFCLDFETLTFSRNFVFSEQAGVTTPADPDPDLNEFSEVTASKLMKLNDEGSFEASDGVMVSIDDVRAAFAPGAELRLFCIGDGASENLVQALANLLQIKVIAFTDARIEFRVEVIEGAEVFNEPALSKRVVVTPSGGQAIYVYNNFEQMVTEDAAKTGKIIRLPRI